MVGLVGGGMGYDTWEEEGWGGRTDGRNISPTVVHRTVLFYLFSPAA
jgi:hypothetical protein